MSEQSVQFEVLDAVVAALGGEAAGAFRCRFEHFDEGELAGGVDNVLPDESTDEYETSDDIDERFRFMVRHTGSAVTGADKMVDARFVRGFKLLRANEAFMGMVRSLRRVGRRWEFEKGEYDTVALVATYEVEFSTSRSDPSVPGF